MTASIDGWQRIQDMEINGRKAARWKKRDEELRVFAIPEQGVRREYTWRASIFPDGFQESVLEQFDSRDAALKWAKKWMKGDYRFTNWRKIGPYSWENVSQGAITHPRLSLIDKGNRYFEVVVWSSGRGHIFHTKPRELTRHPVPQPEAVEIAYQFMKNHPRV